MIDANDLAFLVRFWGVQDLTNLLRTFGTFVINPMVNKFDARKISDDLTFVRAAFFVERRQNMRRALYLEKS